MRGALGCGSGCRWWMGVAWGAQGGDPYLPGVRCGAAVGCCTYAGAVCALIFCVSALRARGADGRQARGPAAANVGRWVARRRRRWRPGGCTRRHVPSGHLAVQVALRCIWRYACHTLRVVSGDCVKQAWWARSCRALLAFSWRVQARVMERDLWRMVL